MKRLVVLGAAESGVGAAVLGKEKGYAVFVSDEGKITDEFKNILHQHNIIFEEEQHTENLIFNADEIVKSPVIPEDSMLIVKLKQRNIPVISEIEFAARYAEGKIIGITGSAGKTTTTLMIYHIMKRAGLDVALAGNIGRVVFMGKEIGGSLASVVAENTHEYYVIEISSFQLDGMYNTKLDVAVLTNISRNHLNRYDNDMQKYTDSKFRITQNQTENNFFIYCADDEITDKELKKRNIKSQQISFSIKQELAQGAYLQNNELIIKLTDKLFTMSIFELALQGKHNIYNSMAAAIAANVFSLRKETIRECLSDFRNIEHRLEFIAGGVHGIEFINDSKSTTVNSTWYALESMNKPTILILGGQDKGNDYSMLNDLVKEKVKAIVCLGIDNTKIHQAFDNIINPVVDASSAEEAVKIAYSLGKKGDVVLLSPACASFDLFKNYADRGRKFKNAVRAL